MNSPISLKNFALAVTRKSPKTVFISIFLYTLAGILEIFSLAAILPVLFQLVSPDNGINKRLELINFTIPGLTLSTALLAVLILMSLRGLVLFLADYNVASMAKKIEETVKNDIYQALTELNWAKLLTIAKGRISNILLRETERYSGAILKLGELASATLIATILITSSILVSWKAFILFILATMPYLFITYFLNKKIKVSANEKIVAANEISTHIHETNFYIKYIKASALESFVQRKFFDAVRNYTKQNLNILFHSRIIKHFPETFGVMILGGLILFTHEYLQESPANIVFFLLLLFRGYKQLANLQTVLSTILERIPSYALCENFLTEMHQFKEGESKQKTNFVKPFEVSLKNISFSYENSEALTLKNINLELPLKGLIACIGMSGSGKTTLGDIILGLLRPHSGQVLLNGEDALSQYDHHTLRKAIGYVPQDVFLISGSIRENILFGAEDQSDQNLYNAVNTANIIEFIETLENGFDTVVGDLGSGLSGGQKQRIAIARALARKPSFLILDEATSALDNKTGKEVQEAILQVSKTTTVLLISHQLSTLKHANCIYVMDKGEILSSGTYETLEKSDPHFKRLLEAGKH